MLGDADRGRRLERGRAGRPAGPGPAHRPARRARARWGRRQRRRAAQGAGTAVGMPLAVDGYPALPGGCGCRRFADGAGGPWSNTVTAVLPPAAFERCSPAAGAGGEAEAGPPGPAGGGWLVWEARPGLGPGSSTPATPGSRPSSGATGSRQTGATASPRPSTRTFHRVRYVTPGGEAFGPWSNTVVPGRAGPPRVRAESGPRRAGPGAAVGHRAVLRMAGARGDLLAVLSMAAHYRRAETVEHLSALTGLEPPPGVTDPNLVRMLDRGEAKVLSHGAVYHPVDGGATATGVRPTPPDGAVTGVIARRSIARGAWVSPGNQPLGSVVALTPALDTGAVGGLRAAGVNVVARRPAGFVPLDADTLSVDSR